MITRCQDSPEADLHYSGDLAAHWLISSDRSESAAEMEEERGHADEPSLEY